MQLYTHMNQYIWVWIKYKNSIFINKKLYICFQNLQVDASHKDVNKFRINSTRKNSLQLIFKWIMFNVRKCTYFGFETSWDDDGSWGGSMWQVSNILVLIKITLSMQNMHVFWWRSTVPKKIVKTSVIWNTSLFSQKSVYNFERWIWFFKVTNCFP